MPLAAHLLPKLEDFILLLNGPFVSPHTRVNHVDPAFPTLSRLSLASWTDGLVEFFGDAGPFLGLIYAGDALCGHLICDPFQNLSLTRCPC